jgi:D-beta-D-heptose 7-phosphate kinase/D-beta-D-heptose 1-phosphate adenosyltransferase
MTPISATVLDRKTASRRSRRLREAGLRVCFTNGCFDLLHPGHLHSLRVAREQGDALFVGLNSDESVRRLKGPGRPVLPLRSRAELLSALRFVDYVVPFDEDTPAELIAAVLPDVLVKGGDYDESDVVGADIVRSRGGDVVIVPLLEGFSTTVLLRELGDSS